MSMLEGGEVCEGVRRLPACSPHQQHGRWYFNNCSKTQDLFHKVHPFNPPPRLIPTVRAQGHGLGAHGKALGVLGLVGDADQEGEDVVGGRGQARGHRRRPPGAQVHALHHHGLAAHGGRGGQALHAGRHARALRLEPAHCSPAFVPGRGAGAGHQGPAGVAGGGQERVGRERAEGVPHRVGGEQGGDAQAAGQQGGQRGLARATGAAQQDGDGGAPLRQAAGNISGGWMQGGGVGEGEEGKW